VNGLATTLRQADFAGQDVKDTLAALAKTTLAPTFESVKNTSEGVIPLKQQFGVAAKDRLCCETDDRRIRAFRSPKSLLPVRLSVNERWSFLPDVRPHNDQNRLISYRVPTVRFSLSSLARGDATHVQC
jgi:hypothetical protein